MPNELSLPPRATHLHPVEGASRGSTTEQHPQAIPSAQLLLGRPSVTIDHDGMHYVLRATRAGKLILTK
ncbi:hemin uptake protein HemP [Aromatoleum bremense]|uniref:Hemin uptake protein HemP n=1 Tax=Aromatoleum bremense TaxID=76115 RepID=A0ABX1P0S2_9RHOO|nr:hemin uptake protein HemP [Aromatoleum bremense]NMG17315.1 hemin uptake protein HemP [Aromatoleum bremense]QTQ32512.1 Hemin uptake family protein, HemP-like [Aromatoleum bremense]